MGITPGSAADLALLDADPSEIGVEEIKDIRATMTIIGGQVAWKAEGN